MRDTKAEHDTERIATLEAELDLADHDIDRLWFHNDVLQDQLERVGALIAAGQITEARALCHWRLRRRP